MTRFRLIRFFLIGGAAVVALVIALSLGLRVVGSVRLRAASERFEKEVGPLSLLAFVKPKLAPERNAVTWLKPGVLAVVLFPSDRAVVGTLAAKPSKDWTAEDLAAFEPLVARNEPALQILGHARGLTESNWEVPYEKGSAAKLPDLLAAMNAGKFLAARGRMALARGDRETAIACTEILGVLADSHQREGATIILLIGSSLERIQLGLVREIVTSDRVTSDELDRVERSLGDTDLGGAFRNALRGEAAALIHDFHSEDQQQKLPRAIPRSMAVGFGDLMMATAIDRRIEIDSTLAAPIAVPIPEADDRNAGWWTRLTGIFEPNIAGAAARGIGTMSARQLAKLSIGLRRQALATGTYPATMELPIDPLSGKPFALATTASGVELRSTTTTEIIKSIYPVALPLNEQIFSWTLPAASRSTTPSRSPAGRRAASS